MNEYQLLENLDGLVIHCPLEEQARELMESLSALGFKWMEGEYLLTEDFHHVFKEDTCYCLEVGSSLKLLTFGDLEYFEEEGFKIIGFDEFKEFLEGDKKWMKN